MAQVELTPEQIAMLKAMVERNERTKQIIETIIQATYLGNRQWCPPSCIS